MLKLLLYSPASRGANPRNACIQRMLPGRRHSVALKPWTVQKCRRDPGGRGDVGGRRQLGGGGDAGGRGLRRRRRDAAALRPRGGAGPEGRLLRRTRHPRRPPGGGGDGLPALRARLREPVPRERHRRVRRRLSGRGDAGAVHPLQRAGEVPRPARRPRSDLEADCMATGHYVRRVDGPDGPELHRAADPARDQSYFLFSTTKRAARLPALSARRARVEGRDPGAGGALRAAGGRQARQPGHLLRAERLLRGGDREAAAGRGRAGRHRRTSTGACSGATRASCATPSASGAGSGSAAGEPLFVVRLDAERRRGRRRAARGAGAARTVPVAEVNWLGDGDFEAAPAEGWEVAVRVRSTRPPVPARVHPGGRTGRGSSCSRRRRAWRRARPASSTRPRARACSAAAGSPAEDAPGLSGRRGSPSRSCGSRRRAARRGSAPPPRARRCRRQARGASRRSGGTAG